MKKSVDLTVGEVHGPKRLDAYLTEALERKFSRAEVKACLDQKKVRLNGKTARPRDPVHEGDRIEGEILSEKISTLEPENIPVSVLYEDECLLVVDKPAGLVVHPGAGNRTGTLVHALLGRKTQLSSSGDPFRPGIVHRLDKDTSGVLVVAKDNASHRLLQAQFASRTLSKTYVALVKGRPEYEEGRVDVPIGRDPKNRLKKAVGQAGRDREALTLYRVLRRFKYCSLIEIRLVTGRTHQIRVHMRHLGHPVVGDPLYGKGEAGRVALHAARIEFLHPKTGKLVKFTSPIPADMNAMIRKAEEE